jgi:hypothetical protein
MPTGQNFLVTAKHSGQALDNAKWSTVSNTPIIQWPIGEQNNQKFRLEETGSEGYYSIINRHSDLAVSVEDTGNGLVQKPVTAGAAQMEWCFSDVGGSYYNIVARSSGQAIEVPGASMIRETQLQQGPIEAFAAHQEWLLAPM